MMGTSKRVTVT